MVENSCVENAMKGNGQSQEKENISPPKWADRFLMWHCDPSLLEEVQGDLYEAFYNRCITSGHRKANVLFILDVLRSISFQNVGKRFRMNFMSRHMLYNFLKSGWRNFLRYKSYSMINLFGLSIGFSATLLLFLIIRYEKSFDRFHKSADRIYRVGNGYTGGGFDDLIVTPQIPVMKNEYPDILNATRFYGAIDIMGYNNNFVRTSYHIVDPGFADMFDFTMIHGDLKSALKSANQIVLTKSTAAKLFGSEPAMGKTVSLVNEKIQFTVAAIADDPPKNSSLQFEALIPWANAPMWLDINQAGNWYNTFMTGYIEVAAGVSSAILEEKLLTFKDTHFLEERRGTWRVILLPFAEEHFRNTNNKSIITILGIIAGSILLISCINFTNLSVAQALKRTNEIGLRRVLGSLKSQVAVQLVTESLITCTFSMLFAGAITWILLPILNSYYEFGITLNFWTYPYTILIVVSICLVPCLFSSLGPSLALSSLTPVNALKNTIKGTFTGEYLRRSLIVLQFTMSTALVIGTAIVWQQTHYMKSHDLNFDINNVVAIETWPELFKDSERARRELLAFRNQLENEESIQSASFTSNVPGGYDENYNYFTSADTTDVKGLSLRQTYVDHNYFQTFSMKIVDGRNFSSEIKSDEKAVIINQTAMKELGWTSINDKELIASGGNDRFKVIGVVEDYFYQSLKSSIQPVIHFYSPENVNRLAVKLNPEKIEQGLAVLKAKWESIGSYEAFNYRFVDHTFDALYKEQDRLTATASLFSLIAVTIAGLGLFSITAYSVRLKRKEVSIRKVLGAPVSTIVISLSKTYGIMILAGFLLACPIIFYLASEFLAGFAHKITLSPIVFAMAGLAIFLFAMLIVGTLSARAALENPVDALKDN